MTQGRTRHRGGGGGAAIAVLALYALVLQGFLGGPMPATALSGAIPCAGGAVQAGSAQDRDRDRADRPAGCCPAVHLAAAARAARGLSRSRRRSLRRRNPNP